MGKDYTLKYCHVYIPNNWFKMHNKPKFKHNKKLIRFMINAYKRTYKGHDVISYNGPFMFEVNGRLEINYVLYIAVEVD